MNYSIIGKTCCYSIIEKDNEVACMSFKSVKTKILAIVLVVLFVSLATVSVVFGILSIKGTESTVQAILQETSKTSALAIQNRISARKDVVSEIGTIARLSNPGSTYAEKRQVLDSKVKEYGLIDVSIADTSGMDLEGNYVGDKEFFSRALTGESFYSSPEVKADGSGTLIYISAPLWDKGLFNTSVVGVVYMTLDGKALSDMANTITIAKTGYAYIIDKDTRFLAHKDESLVNSSTSVKKMGESDKLLEPLAQLAESATKGETCFGEYYYKGVDKFAVFSPIEGSEGWFICLNLEKSEFMQTSYTALMICIGISLASLILASIIIIAFANAIVKPIREVEKAAKELSEGNFDYEIKYSSGDEIGNLAESMRIMIAKTKDVIEDTTRGLEEMSKGNFNVQLSVEFVGIFKKIEKSMIDIIQELSQTLSNIKTSADQVDLGAEQVSTGSQALAQGSIEQASSIEELAAAINEISEKVKENSQQAIVANEKTTKVGQDLQSSNKQMNSMMLAMEDISEKSKEISKIIKSIEDIAFQTNILALNAAVEAARAGAAGKGFAVVADEVRNLAGKSAEAAKDTTILIEETVKSVEEGSAIAVQTAEAMKSVVENAGEVVVAINQISTAFKEQADSIDQVTIGLDQISAVVQSNSATAEESAAASEELSGQASMLQEEVDKFKLKSHTDFNLSNQ